jgi:hypothetical protein
MFNEYNGLARSQRLPIVPGRARGYSISRADSHSGDYGFPCVGHHDMLLDANR